MARNPIGKVIEVITIHNLRKSIKQRIPGEGYILDDGSGFHGSWDYENRKDIASIDLVYGDKCTHLSFKDKEFDMVVLAGTLQYIDQSDKALEEVHRVLKKKGKFILTTINRDSLLRNLGLITKQPKFGEHHIYSIAEVENLLGKYKFKILEKWGISFFPFQFGLCSNICYLCEKK